MDINNILNTASRLKNVVKNIENKVINKDLLINANNILKEIIQILSINSKNKEIIKILESFIGRISAINLDDVQLDAFEYLGYIMYDLDKFLNDYYIEKIHQDEYIIRDSLANNINLFFDYLYNKNSDTSALDFF